MPTNSKELVRSLFSGKPISRPPFIPYMATAAAQFMQVPVKQMFSDPTTLANSLQACQRLFKYDATTVLLDTTLEAEALGCQIEWQEREPPKVVSHLLEGKAPESLDVSGIETRGRIPVVLEAARRLSQTTGRDVALLGVMTGPITLGRHLMGDDFIHALDRDTQTSQKLIDLWEKIALTLARAFGELKFDAIVLADKHLASLLPIHYPKIQPSLKTLHNLVNFYDAPLIILTGLIPPVPLDRFTAFFRLEADGFSVTNPLSELKSLSPSDAKLLGRCIPRSVLVGSVADVDRAMSELTDKSMGSSFFITSEWEVPPTTPALNLHKVMQRLTAAPAK
jgi:uroporphyrinogen-III decarboxylase